MYLTYLLKVSFITRHCNHLMANIT